MGVDASAAKALAFAAVLAARYQRELAEKKITPAEIRADCEAAAVLLTQDWPRFLDPDLASMAHGNVAWWRDAILGPRKGP
jgi:hypothetical protein